MALVSETRITWERGGVPDQSLSTHPYLPQNVMPKALVVRDDLAVAVAGPDPKERLSLACHLGSVDVLTPHDLENRLAAEYKDGEFLIASLMEGNRRLLQIRAGQVVEIEDNSGPTWIGDATAFSRFEELLQNPPDLGPSWLALFTSMQSVVMTPVPESLVGGHVLGVVEHEGRFRYYRMPTTILTDGVTRMDVLIGTDGTPRAVGLFVDRARAGVLWRADPWTDEVIGADSIDDFVQKARGFGQSLR